MSCFMTGGSGEEHGTNKPPPTGRVRERSKGDTTMSDQLPESFSLASILAEQGLTPPGRTQNDWLKTTRKLIPSP